MDSCLLCLERNKDILETIEINSKPWQKFNISTVLEKHFWPLSTLQTDSWICLGCWQKVNDFHNFYVVIEKTHLALGQIKIEEQTELILESIENNQTNEGNEDIKLTDATDEATATTTVEFLIDKMETEDSNDYSDMEEEFEDTPDNSVENITLNETSLENQPQDIQNNTDTEDSTNNNNNNNAPDDNPNEEAKIKGRRPKSITNKCNDNNEESSIEELDAFIAKEFGQINCDLCNVPLKDFNETNRHFLRVHKQSPYIKCCNKKFQRRNLLVDHLNCHLNPEYFKCKDCNKIFTCRSNLNIHVIRFHPPENVKFKYNCEDCGKSFPMNCMLRKHELSHLKTIGEYPCTECGKVYRAEHHLKRHFDVTHLKKCARICVVCGRSFDTGNMLRAHMTLHEPQVPVNCDVCGILLSNERNYLIHKKIQHPEGGAQEHHCNMCGKIYPTRRALSRHVNKLHKKGLDQKCTVCEKAFKYATALREHMATHTGETLYTCAYCPKTYNSRANLLKHRQNMHAKEWAIDKHKKYYGTQPMPNTNES